jgi:hypothetical protein
VQYRSDAVVSYDTMRKNAPIYAGEYTLVNAMLSYNVRPAGAKWSMRLQLNIDNLLNNQNLQVIDARSDSRLWLCISNATSMERDEHDHVLNRIGRGGAR